MLDQKNFKCLSQTVYKVFMTMDIVSAAISASEFTISNYKLLVLSLLSCCCILFLVFFCLGSRGFIHWKCFGDNKLPKALSLQSTILFYSPSWQVLSSPMRTSKVIGASVPPCVSSLFLVILLTSNCKSQESHHQDDIISELFEIPGL